VKSRVIFLTANNNGVSHLRPWILARSGRLHRPSGRPGYLRAKVAGLVEFQEEPGDSQQESMLEEKNRGTRKCKFFFLDRLKTADRPGAGTADETDYNSGDGKNSWSIGPPHRRGRPSRGRPVDNY